MGATMPTNRLGRRKRAVLRRIITGMGLRPLVNRAPDTTLRSTREPRLETAARARAMATRRLPAR